jgi:hypothetical protein
MNDHARKLLGIYLNDHLAALVTARELARRTSSGATNSETQSVARDLVAHLTRSERELERLLGDVGARPSRVKRALAAAAEKGGRLKLNGHIATRSPLSDLVELEGLTVLLEYEAGLWRSLAHAAPELARSENDFADRARQACEWRERLATHARRIAVRSLRPRSAAVRR